MKIEFFIVIIITLLVFTHCVICFNLVYGGDDRELLVDKWEDYKYHGGEKLTCYEMKKIIYDPHIAFILPPFDTDIIKLEYIKCR